MWSQHGLGLQDETGALSRSRIDLETSQDIVDDAVACIHSTLEDIGLQFIDDMPDLPRVSCKSLYGVCQKHPFFKKFDILCRQLARQTADRKLPTGSLVTLELKGIASSSSSRSLSSAFFLGALFQRPLQQVLVKAWPQRTSNDGLQKFSLRQDSGDAVPNFQTSHTVFLDFAKEMMAAADPGATAVSVTVLSYEFENYLWSVQQLQVTVTGSVLHRFELGFSQPESEAKPKFELPFGLKLKKKPRKAQQRARGRGGRHGRAARRGRGHKVRKSTSPADSAVSQNSSGSDSDSVAGSIVADGQEAVMPTDIAAQENAEVAHATAEYRAEHRARDSVAESFRRTGAAPTGSYFVKEIGFYEADVAVSNRSVCLHCGEKVAKGSVRYSYHWHPRRPSRWMHHSCAVAFVAANPAERQAQAVSAFSNFASTSTVAAVRSATEDVLATLL